MPMLFIVSDRPTLSLGRDVAQSAPLASTMMPVILGPETDPPLIGRMTLD